MNPEKPEDPEDQENPEDPAATFPAADTSPAETNPKYPEHQ
jgi:hypothetical protein